MRSSSPIGDKTFNTKSGKLDYLQIHTELLEETVAKSNAGTSIALVKILVIAESFHRNLCWWRGTHRALQSHAVFCMLQSTCFDGTGKCSVVSPNKALCESICDGLLSRHLPMILSRQCYSFRLLSRSEDHTAAHKPQRCERRSIQEDQRRGSNGNRVGVSLRGFNPVAGRECRVGDAFPASPRIQAFSSIYTPTKRRSHSIIDGPVSLRTVPSD